MLRKFVGMMALVAALGTAACGDDGTGVSNLTEAEAQDLAGVVLVSTFGALGSQPAPAADGPALAPIEYEAAVETVVPCQNGGEVAVNGTLTFSGDTESEASRIAWGMGQVHNACAAVSESGRAFTLWGNPGVEVDFVMETDEQGLVAWVGSVDGTLDWATEDKDGTCEIFVEFSGSMTAEGAFSGNASGRVCNISVSESFEVG